jgi:membrane protein
MWKRIKENRWVARADGVVRAFLKHDDMSLAAAVAFYTAFSFAPLVLLISTVGGLLGEGTKQSLIQLFEQQLGPRASEVTEAVVENAAKASSTGNLWRWVVGGVVLLISSSAVFGQLQLSLNSIWEVSSKRHSGVWAWVRKRLLSLGMVLAALFILLVSLVLTSAVEHFVPGDDGAGWAARAATFGGSLVISAMLFGAIFRVLPDAEIPWRDVWRGALLTAALFTVGKFALGLYLDWSTTAASYGKAAGALVALLVWVYYSCIILFVGAELTRQLGTARGNTV